ncbi:MAG: DUF2188 domain-containing protein [Microthrixaceae bacterium]|nr:DUF2188 domain-containing protein [Microthrixaceae bacterium]
MPHGDVETFHQDGQWRNRIEGDQILEGSFETKAEAVDAGRELARSRQVEHIIRKENGQISDRSTYGEDPRDIRG